MNVFGQNKRFLRLFQLTFLALALTLLSTSCAEKMICPAYQSAFIFDTTALRKKFSYFVNDTPKIYGVSKNKFLLIEPRSTRQILASFRTIEMLPIYPVIPDSLRFQADVVLLGDLDIRDSTGQVPLHPGLIGKKFNVEQENYMYYFRKTLVLPDVRAGVAERASAKRRRGPIQWVKDLFSRNKEPEVTDAEEEPENKGFFSRLRGKKKGEDAETDPNDPTQLDSDDPPAKEPFFQRIFKKQEDPADSNNPGNQPTQIDSTNDPPKENFFQRLFKRKKKTGDPADNKSNDTKPKDDGF